MDEIIQYKERLRIALSAAKICIFEVDLARQLYTFFENAEVIFGVQGETILKQVRPFCKLEPEAYRRAVSEYFSHPDDEEVIGGAFASILSGHPATYEARMRAGGSEFVWCRLHMTPILEEGVPVRMVGIITDITEQKECTDSLRQAVNLDGFTGLYNKGYTMNYISEIFGKDRNLRHALVIVDIDNFKRFNDTFGHNQGDEIIKGVSRKLKETFRKKDVVGRFGGDEFVVLVRNIEDGNWLENKLNKLVRFEVGEYICTISAGVAIFPCDGETFREVFERADRALYEAKRKKGRVVFYSKTD